MSIGFLIILFFCEKYPSFCFTILIIYKIYGILIPYYRKRQRGKQKNIIGKRIFK